jgi:molybdopterin biosynthesis enzyme
MSEANCMVVLGHDELDIQAGHTVNVIPFNGLI